MWLQTTKGKEYWYMYADWFIPGKTIYLGKAKWWEVILNELFGYQPETNKVINRTADRRKKNCLKL